MRRTAICAAAAMFAIPAVCGEVYPPEPRPAEVKAAGTGAEASRGAEREISADGRKTADQTADKPAAGAENAGEGTSRSEPIPKKAAAYLKISRRELKEILARGGAMLVDVNDPRRYKISHIGNAVNVKYDAVSGAVKENKLSKDKNAILIFYGLNEHCPAARYAAVEAIRTGYRDVRVYEEGIEGWERWEGLEEAAEVARPPASPAAPPEAPAEGAAFPSDASIQKPNGKKPGEK